MLHPRLHSLLLPWVALALVGQVDKLPAKYAAQIQDVDEICRSKRLSQPIAQWQTATVRSRYQSILKSAGNDATVEEAIRGRLASVTRDEQAAQAAARLRRFSPKAIDATRTWPQ